MMMSHSHAMPLLETMDGWLLLMAGLMSAGHCIGMCGGLVTAYSMESADLSNQLPAFTLGVLFRICFITVAESEFIPCWASFWNRWGIG